METKYNVKGKYEIPEIQVMKFDHERSIITTSGIDNDVWEDDNFDM